MITLHSKDGEEIVIKGVHIPGVLEDPDAPYKDHFSIVSGINSTKDELFIQLKNFITVYSINKDGVVYILNVQPLNIKDTKGNVIYELRYRPKTNYVGAFLRSDLDGRIETDCLNHYNAEQLLNLMLVLLCSFDNGVKMDHLASKRNLVMDTISDIIKRNGCSITDICDYVLGIESLKMPVHHNKLGNKEISMLYWRNSDKLVYEVTRNKTCTTYYSIEKWSYEDLFHLAIQLIHTFEND